MRPIPVLLIALCLALAGCKDRKTTETTEVKAPPAVGAHGTPPSLAPMLKRASPAVVNIAVKGTVQTAMNPLFRDPMFRRFFNIPDQPSEQQVQGIGSGIVYDGQKGYIITNNHVIARADSIMVTLSDRRQLKAKLVGSDEDTDVAVLKVEGTGLIGMAIGDSSKLQVGDYVVAIGNPFGVGQTATFGIVSATGRSGLGIEGYEDFIQTDASINLGNSGGALLNFNGELVGMNTAILSQSGGSVGIGFAIPINMVRNVAEQLIAHGKVMRGQLGVIIQDLTPPIAEAMGIESTGGAVVSRVLPDSSAGAAGVEAGDAITEVDGRPLRDSSDLRNTIGLKAPGTKVKLTILRRGDKRIIEATITESKGGTAAAENAPEDSPINGVSLSGIPAGHPLSGKVEGVFVQDVAQGSAAAEAGLAAGDIILSANKTAVKTPKELFDVITSLGEKPLLLNIRRGDDPLYIIIQ